MQSAIYTIAIASIASQLNSSRGDCVHREFGQTIPSAHRIILTPQIGNSIRHTHRAAASSEVLITCTFRNFAPG
jgi:hypothetical protein